MKVLAKRTAVCGGGLAYELYVPIASVPKHVVEAHPGGIYHTRTRLSECDGDLMDFVHASLPVEHELLPQGVERWESWKQHEERAEIAKMAILRRAFPELLKYPGDKPPFLWANNLMDTEESLSVWLEAELA